MLCEVTILFLFEFLKLRGLSLVVVLACWTVAASRVGKGQGLWIVVAKIGMGNDSKFVTEMWIGSDEFGLGSVIMCFPRQGEHEYSSHCVLQMAE
eukprot:1149104-Pelagomonas_calceolata.AAC.1